MTAAGRRVWVVIRRALSEPRAGQGLRAAVAYAAYGLDVTVILCGAQDASPAALVQRHLQTLRALGKEVVTIAPDDAAALCRQLNQALPEPGDHRPAPTVIVW